MSAELIEDLDNNPELERVTRPMSVVVFWPVADSEPDATAFISDEVIDRLGTFVVGGFAVPMMIERRQY